MDTDPVIVWVTQGAHTTSITREVSTALNKAINHYSAKRLPQHSAVALYLLHEYGDLTARDVNSVLFKAYAKTTGDKALNRLRALGYVERIQPTGTQHVWRVVE